MKLIWGIICYFILFCADGFCETQGTLHLRIKNITSSEGKMIVLIWDNPQDFLKDAEKPYRRLKYTPKLNEMSVEIPEFVIGKSYAIFVHHDLYERNFVKKDLFGRPLDPFAFSKGSENIFSPPDYEDVAITLETGHTSLTVELK